MNLPIHAASAGVHRSLSPKLSTVFVDGRLGHNWTHKILWSDGHDTGIYSLEYLRGLEKPELIPAT
jgi:DUF971 family protein